VQLEKNYQKSGVRFLSLSADSKAAVETFVGLYDVSWPSAFGVPKETINAFGALNPDPASSKIVRPTLYVVGRDGRIVYSDMHARYQHKPSTEVYRELKAAIDAALVQPTAEDNSLPSASAG